jgi:hypothetical protein
MRTCEPKAAPQADGSKARPEVSGQARAPRGRGRARPWTLLYVALKVSASAIGPTRTTFSRTCCISSSESLRPGHPEGYPGPCPLSTALAAIRAAAAWVGGFPLLAVLVYVADEYPAFDAGTGTLQAGVVSLYGVVVLLGRWVRVWCARLCGVHEAPPRGPGSGVLHHPRGHSFIRHPDFIISNCVRI